MIELMISVDIIGTRISIQIIITTGIVTTAMVMIAVDVLRVIFDTSHQFRLPSIDERHEAP